MTSMCFATRVGLIALSTALAAPALAGEVVGTVTGDNDTVTLRAAEVRIVELNRVATTSGDGSFVFGDVPAGEYTIEASYVGAETASQTINVPETGEVNVTLALLSNQGETIVVIGQLGWGDAGLAAGAELVAEGSLRVLGYQPDEHLAALYRQSRTLLFPSIYEGFGMPTVEALSSGKRPILSDIPVMHEIAAAEADFVEATSIEAWAVALRQAIDDSGHDDGRYVESACARGRLYDWRRNAAETRAIYAEAAASFGTAS